MQTTNTSSLASASESKERPLLRVRNLCKSFPIHSKGLFVRHVGDVKAVNDVSFDLARGETLGIVGESGSGKTTCARTVLRALEPTSGEIEFYDDREVVDLANIPESKMKPVRKKIQMIFQDPFSSLNPRMTVAQIVEEPLVIHGVRDRKELDRKVVEVLEKVGLKSEHRQRYPHAFSGGQRQRIGIARALILNPSLIVADEAVSALDVSVQAQVINLLADLQQEFGLTYIFVAHDLSVVRHICDRVAVMYAGRIVEIGETEELFADPKHPYTRELLSSVPSPDPDIKLEMMASGEVADAGKLPSGCSFHPRCPHAVDRCRVDRPELSSVSAEETGVACHLVKDDVFTFAQKP